MSAAEILANVVAGLLVALLFAAIGAGLTVAGIELGRHVAGACS